MALPTPSSARLSTVRIDANRLLRPRYSGPRVLIMMVRITKGTSKVTSLSTVAKKCFVWNYAFCFPWFSISRFRGNCHI